MWPLVYEVKVGDNYPVLSIDIVFGGSAA